MLTRILMIYLIAGEIVVFCLVSFSSKFQTKMRTYSFWEAAFSCGYMVAIWPRMFRWGVR